MYQLTNDEFNAIYEYIVGCEMVMAITGVDSPGLADLGHKAFKAYKSAKERKEHTNEGCRERMNKYREENPKYFRGKKLKEYMRTQEEQ